MEHLRRYQFVWKMLRLIARPLLRHKIRYTAEVCKAKGPFLVLCNHNTDWDPLLLGCAFPSYMSFVASEHIFRWKRAGRLIVWLMAPIARAKGTTAVDTAKAVLQHLHDGVSVAMFAEGNRSFNGLTCEISPAAGKLARLSGAALVTYRIDGGYFTSPRWSGSRLRKGRTCGRVVRVYSSEELKSMKAHEINDAIRQDLFADAYALQREQMVPYKGKALAEHLERVLCLCPRCGRLDTLRSSGDLLRCGCGFSVRYNEYGFLEGKDAPYDNITEWDAAQTAELCRIADAAVGPIFSDPDMVLKEIFSLDHSEAELGSGDMTLFRDRLTCCGQVFPLKQLEGFALHGPQTVDFSAGGRSFEISSSQVRCTRKYWTVIRYLKEKTVSE